MLPIVITSLVLSKLRSVRELFPRQWTEKWERYLQQHLQLRIVVMLSLIFQITLIALGGCRKKTHHYWIRFVIWCAYLSADAVAIYAVGVSRIEEGDNLLRSFWAPFLLMHLGGPDTITAYALEDNEFWLRHGVTLVNQTAATLYILFETWHDSYLSWLSLFIFICGVIKYSERVWALWAGSSETFRDSIPQRHQTISRLLEEEKLKEAEGHVVVTHQVIEPQQALDGDVGKDWRGEILTARSLIDIFQPAFTDQLLSLDDAACGRSTLEDWPCDSVFNIIAIELGFIYDLMFTKSILFRTPWGVVSRIVTLFLTIITLGVFTSLYRNEATKHNKTDLAITFALMVAAVCLELFGLLFQHIFSDKFVCWLIKHKRTTILRIINSLRPLSKRQRWSGKIGQFSLLSYSLREKHYIPHLEIRGFQSYFYLSHRNVQDILKSNLYDHIKLIPGNTYMDLQSLWDLKWTYAEKMKPLESLEWSTPKRLDFDVCVLTWHIATVICCYASQDEPDGRYLHEGKHIEDMRNDAEISLDLSRYMLYLLVMYPSLLPAGIGRIKFEDMHSMMTTFFKQYESTGRKKPNKVENQTNAKNDPRKELNIFDWCNQLQKPYEEARRERATSDNHTYAQNYSRNKLNIFGWCDELLGREAKNITKSNSKPKLMDACNKLLKQVDAAELLGLSQIR